MATLEDRVRLLEREAALQHAENLALTMALVWLWRDYLSKRPGEEAKIIWQLHMEMAQRSGDALLRTPKSDPAQSDLVASEIRDRLVAIFEKAGLWINGQS